MHMSRYPWTLPCCLALLWSASAPVAAQQTTAAVADFDYDDTSGEARDQSLEHAARMRDFAEALRDRLSDSTGLRVFRLACDRPVCSVESMGTDAVLEAARHGGARVLVYGGVHKMSTLVQWGRVQALDLAEGRLLLDRSFSFRGDNDEAFARAARFVAQTLQAVLPVDAGGP